MNDRIIKYRTELRLAEAKRRIEAREAEKQRELEKFCPNCESRYEQCRCR